MRKIKPLLLQGTFQLKTKLYLIMHIMVIIIAEILAIWKMRKVFFSRKDIRRHKMKILKNILNRFMLLVGAKSELTDEAVNDGICDFGGQGRNEFGK